jgi:HNH endonuclease
VNFGILHLIVSFLNPYIPISMNQCIYCKKLNVVFNREHVIPKAFGSFGAETMVLKNSVCQTCNEDFGKEIDQVLSRDSFEDLLRAQILGPQRKKRERFRSRRVKMYFTDNENCEILRGASLEMDWNIRRLILLDQIIVRSKAGKLAYFYEQEFEREDASEILALPKGAVRVLGTNAAKVEGLMKLIYDKGFN